MKSRECPVELFSLIFKDEARAIALLVNHTRVGFSRRAVGNQGWRAGVGGGGGVRVVVGFTSQAVLCAQEVE